MMVFAPSTVQRIPLRSSRTPVAFLHPASRTPLTTHRPNWRKRVILHSAAVVGDVVDTGNGYLLVSVFAHRRQNSIEISAFELVAARFRPLFGEAAGGAIYRLGDVPRIFCAQVHYFAVRFEHNSVIPAASSNISYCGARL